LARDFWEGVSANFVAGEKKVSGTFFGAFYHRLGVLRSKTPEINLRSRLIQAPFSALKVSAVALLLSTEYLPLCKI